MSAKTAARRDGTFGDELEEAGEKLVDVDTALELGDSGRSSADRSRESFGGC
jgi:hypothetical protein